MFVTLGISLCNLINILNPLVIRGKSIHTGFNPSMDYLNPKKEQQHRTVLLVGYVFVAIAIAMATIVLLHQAYGYGIGKNGTVIQNGLSYFSSHPKPAKIYVNGQLKPVTTNTRLFLPEGIYKIKLSRDGYRDWQRTIELDGGSVVHFDYPLLIPKTLTTKKIHAYSAQPGLLSQSPNRRWLIVQQSSLSTNFDLYDLKNPTKPATALSLPVNLTVKPSTTNESWQAVDWADDNLHLLLQHKYDDKTEFILLNRQSPEQSQNITNIFSTSAPEITFRDKKFDQYYFYNPTDGTLQNGTLKTAVATNFLDHVIEFKAYGADTVLYVTDSDAASGNVLLKLKVADSVSSIRSLPASNGYLVDLTKYSGTMYVAAGAISSNKVYIFKDPLGQLSLHPGQVATPVQVLRVEQPNYLSFSANAQFIVTENSSRFGVYDIENEKGYSYTVPLTIDAPQTNAHWMDGNRLTVVSNGRLNIFDYDGTNLQSLQPNSPSLRAVFDPDYKAVYGINSNQNGQYDLNETSLLTAADR